MVNRNGWGHSYLTVRGEILRFVKDELLRKHLPRTFPLIKNERHHQAWSLRLNLTQHGETHQVQTEITSLPFVHTARRSYRSSDPVNYSDRGFSDSSVLPWEVL
ncbi:hypothetical protein BcabD6B2_14780 [Babesia caballi]|uniref:Uncharacterized protein n=1 Tax=Babesia caballi TaxID=5871 RepID=A0AAV4LQP0_BABCB|nr:hypothetical protein BcabD6B2_14780 [Babesia caballi]